MVKTNILGSIATAAGFSLGLATINSRSSPSSILFSPFYLILIGLAANAGQMALLQFLNRFWRSRKLSLAMMPTAFFAFNLVGFASFLSSYNLNQLYLFLSSLAFLPALVLVGVGTGSMGQKTSNPPNIPRQRITVTGDTLLRQGRQQTLKISTEPGGQARSADLRATITRPGGKSESLKVKQVSQGQYKAFYQPRSPGTYIVHVASTSKGRATGDQSFSFDVQAPPPHHSPPPLHKPPTLSHLPQSPPPSAPPPTPQVGRPSLANLPRLDNWNPQAWVNQDIHGYKVKEHLATGLTGYVLRASFEHNGTEVAIKIPILKPGTGTTALEETMSEATRLLELSEQSKYVVQLRGILVDRLNVQEILKGDSALYLRSPPAIVMEFMRGGTAKRLIEDPSYESLFYSEKWGGIVMLIGYMIATGLETIHKAGFVHLDVKPQNILFNAVPPTTGGETIGQIQSGGLVPKLADLGSAVKVGGKANQFTSEYAPGEQVLGNGAAPSMDIYALGATMHSLLTKTPFNSQRLIEAMNNAPRNQASGKATSELRLAWDSFDPDFSRIDKFQSAIPILKGMLSKDAQKRPEAGTVASSLRNLKDLRISS